MSLLTLKALADLGIAGAQTLGDLQNIDEKTRQALSDAGAAKLAGQETYADLTEGNQFRVRQAPTGAADLTLSLAEQGLDRTRDRGSEALAGATANLGVDPRTGIAGVQRLLGQLGQMEGAAEQRAAEQSIGAQKIIDDSIYNQQEAERRRLEGLKTQFELVPAMQEYTRATGAAEALDQARRDTANQFISDALASTTNLIAGLDRNKSTTNNNTGDANKARLMNDYLLQTQLAQPIPIVDSEYDAEMARRRSAPTIDDDQNIFGGGEITIDPEEELTEDLFPLAPLQTKGPMQVPNITSPNVIMINGVAIPATAEEELPDFDKGGTYIGERGGMTSGEFDHDTNKKAIVDEGSGKKEGELTGGEGVLAEDHLADIVQMIKDGDEDGLFAYLKGLLQEPQFGYDFA
jgi:hypothetical protein